MGEGEMRQYRGWVALEGYGSKVEFEFEAPVDASQDELEYQAQCSALDNVQWAFEAFDDDN